jgi:acyl-CoA reductase-like NAD-dependent aldehyde dehydrogenase
MTIQDFKMFIDGEWVASSSNKKIETLNPENNEVWATVPEANEEDVDKAVKLLKELSKKLGEIYTQLREENI